MKRTREEIEEEYDQMYKDKPDRWSDKPRRHFMIQLLMGIIPDPHEVVDVGCGNGVTLQMYQKYSRRPQLYGIDLSPEAIRLSKKRVPEGFYTTEDNFEDIKQFDLVICMGTAEHAQGLLPFLISLKQKVAENGFCYFEVPHNLAYSKGREEYRQLQTRSRQWEWHLSRESWRDLLLRAGFEIVKSCEGLNVVWEFIWVLK